MAILTATEKVFVIVNPTSGRAAPERLRSVLEESFGTEPATASYEVHETTPDEDVSATSRQAVEQGHSTVVAAGGDGTVSAVANGLIGTSGRLGIIPLGTANVLAHELGIPMGLPEACRLLAGPHATIAIDAMTVGENRYLTQIGIGLDALMIRDTTSENKRRFGILAYLWTAARRMAGFQPIRFSISVDGQSIRPRAAQIVLGNCGALGASGLRWGPGIQVDDGRIDVCVIRARSAWSHLGAAWSALLGRHRLNRGLKYLTAEEIIAIQADRPLPIQADGEIIGETPIEVRVEPAALRVIVPADADTESHP